MPGDDTPIVKALRRAFLSRPRPQMQNVAIRFKPGLHTFIKRQFGDACRKQTAHIQHTLELILMSKEKRCNVRLALPQRRGSEHVIDDGMVMKKRKTSVLRFPIKP